MYNVLLWILQLVLLTEGSVKKYDISTYSDETISMDYDQFNGIDVLMYMTVDLIPRQGSRLHIRKTRDTDNLHFYFSDIKMTSCQDISLHISTGDSMDRLSPYPGLPSVCGHMANKLANVNHMSSETYLSLDLTWSNTTSVRGIVFRFVANVYTCDSNCTKAEQCTNGVCVHGDLKRETNYEFCDDSVVCNTTLSEIEELKTDLSAYGVIALAVVIVIYVPGLACLCFCRSRESGECEIFKRLGMCLTCCCSAIGSCCRGISGCLRGVRDMMRMCCRRVSDYLGECSQQSQVLETPMNSHAVPSTSEMTPFTSLDRPPARLVSRDSDTLPVTLPIGIMSHDTELFLDDTITYADDVSEEEEEGAPPSYATAIAMSRRQIPTAPPLHLSESDPPPEYASLVPMVTMSNMQTDMTVPRRQIPTAPLYDPSG